MKDDTPKARRTVIGKSVTIPDEIPPTPPKKPSPYVERHLQVVPKGVMLYSLEIEGGNSYIAHPSQDPPPYNHLERIK